jgi:hypothetical protein
MANASWSANRRSARVPWRLIALGACLTLVAWHVLMPRSRVGAPRPIRADESIRADSDPRHDEAPKTAFEPSDWPLRPVALVYIAVLVLLVISSFVLMAAYPTSLSDVDRTLRIDPPGPRLETDNESGLRAFRAEEEKRLNTYYWIDKQKGIVHIPINEAMKKVVKTGLPGFAKAQQ